MAGRDPAMGHVFLSPEGLLAERLNVALAQIEVLSLNVSQLWSTVSLLATELDALKKEREASCVSESSGSES